MTDHDPAPTPAAGAADEPPLGKRLRALRMGLQTVLGLKRQGFFIPYRHADGVDAPGTYAALEPIFTAARPAFQRVLDGIATRRGALTEIGGAPAPAPRWDQTWFTGLDAAAAYALAAERRPRRIVEVGSGHSTRFLAQAIADEKIACEQICIDPAPRAALTGLAVDWRRGLLDDRAHGPLFDALGPGDVAVFDSSHLLQPGTDVDMIFNRILPRLGSGVLVHIHDVFLPDPYPAAWTWRGYNEQNALGPLLIGGGWGLVFASAFVRSRMRAAAVAALGPSLRPPASALETSLWLETA